MAPATSTATPPALPPSVEEAYRRKCIQLKQRTSEVEDSNDAARLRLARLKRQVEKMRLERAFLLEQLAKRTSANVEDSDGSPSPPPTPKEKPLRIKRGHRKPSMLNSFETPAAGAGGNNGGGSASGGGGGATFLGHNLPTHSPSSDTFSAQHLDTGAKANGVHGRMAAPKRPGTAFDMYCEETRSSANDKSMAEADTDTAAGAGGVEVEEEELARGWKDLSDARREEFEARADDELTKYHQEKDAYDDAKAEVAKKDEAEADAETDRRDRDLSTVGGGSPPPQEDVEMGNYDTDPETQGEKGDDV